MYWGGGGGTAIYGLCSNNNLANHSSTNCLYDNFPSVILLGAKVILVLIQLQLQLPLYSFPFNLQLHDSFHPRIGEPNRGGGRDTQI